MEPVLYFVARLLIACIRVLPLRWVARLGRCGGALAYWLDSRHRRVALRNLTMCFAQEKSEEEIRALARENFKRIGENFACAVRTSFMDIDQLRAVMQVEGLQRLYASQRDEHPNIVVAIGHFGNFELYARFAQFQTGFQSVTTYRSLREPSLNRLLQSMRERSGCLYFERRTQGADLKAVMNRTGILLGLLADQHAGDRGLRIPFFGHDCSTSTAPAVFALRYQCALYTGVCFRQGLAQWRFEVGEQIATTENGRPRSVAAIMRDVNDALETAVRRDPANWFWVHNRWKPAKLKQSPALSTA
jgi:KDO2-lipid IV(A) lauroyltransferase